MRESVNRIEITTGTLARFLLLVLGLIFLFAIRDVVLIVLVSIVLASAVDPLVRWFSQYRIPRVISVMFIYLIGISVFLSIFYFLLPPLVQNFQGLFTGLPDLMEDALVRLQDKIQFLSTDFVIENLKKLANNAGGYVDDAAGGFFQTASTLFSGLVSFIFVIVISFYLAVQDDGVGNVLRVVTPKEYEEYILNLWGRSKRKIGRWLQGQLLLGLIVGVIVFIALSVLQVEYALMLALLSALFEMIPYFGPIMAAIPAIAVATIQDPFLGLLVLGVYVVVQQMENHLIYPQVVRKTVGVPPLLAIIALLVGGKLAGIMGFIIAVPLAVVLVEYLNDYALHKSTLE